MKCKKSLIHNDSYTFFTRMRLRSYNGIISWTLAWIVEYWYIVAKIQLVSCTENSLNDHSASTKVDGNEINDLSTVGVYTRFHFKTFQSMMASAVIQYTMRNRMHSQYNWKMSKWILRNVRVCLMGVKSNIVCIERANAVISMLRMGKIALVTKKNNIVHQQKFNE